ncbi:MAG: cation:proton antiporter [Chlamydiales bacterium]|nr:cation:proton antiporter [Chlamydiales bacterium]
MSEFFIQIVLILLSARLLGELAACISIPAVIGELCAGVLLGPSLLGWVHSTETIHSLAEIGVVLLLFEIGLETNIANLMKVKTKAIFSACMGVIVPFVLGFVLPYYVFHQDLLLSLFIGGTLTATSIGVTLRVMSELKKQQSYESQIVLGAAIIDDVIGIVILSILYEFSTTRVIDIFNIGKVLLFVVVFLLISPILVKSIASLIKYYNTKSAIPGLLPTMIVSLLLFFAWLAREFGAPELIGGFAAGLALSKSFSMPFFKFLKTDKRFSTRIEHTLKPIVHLFVPIFFVNIGLTLDLKEISWGTSFIWIFSSAIFLAAILGKLSAGFILLKDSKWVKWAVGLAMIPRGEVGLVFADVGKSNGVFGQEIYASITLVIAMTTLFGPLALRWFYKSKSHCKAHE